MHLKLNWPHLPDLAYRENFYLGGWHPNPNEPITFEWTTPSVRIEPVVIQSGNWFLLSNTSTLHSHKPGLIHAIADESGNHTEAVAFRGYVLAPPIHSYSSSKAILKYWLSRNPCEHEHNGVFSAVRIRDNGRTLELVSDAFGIAPLYYRRLGELILFSTNSRYLVAENDEPDYMAWRCLIQSGFIAADRTLSASIRRVPAGDALQFHHDSDEQCHWFNYESLPKGIQRIDDNAVAKVEQAFQNALSRCLGLKADGNILPLSSGYDSRRILAGFIKRKVPFKAATVRVYQKSHRDLDAKFASLMAKELGFPHYVVEAQNILEYVYDDYQRRVLIDAETDLHTWAIALMRSLPEYPTLFFDGLAGDALGEAGFDEISGLHASPELNKMLILKHTINDDYNAILSPGKWPSAKTVRDEIGSYIETLPSGINQAELAFLLFRTRRAIAPWSQQILPAGHVAVYPYLDLDYIKTTLQYCPADKLHESFQKLCLEKFWPQYSLYFGSREIPPDMQPGDPAIQDRRELECLHQLYSELKDMEGTATLKNLLTRQANIRFWIALNNDRMALITMWAFRRLLEIVSRETSKIPCWKILSEK